MEKIYLDHGATTPLHPDVIATITKTLTTDFGNPSSIHHFGRQAQQQLEKARQVIADSIHSHEKEIIFTSGGTESNNLAILQTARLRRAAGNHLITSQIEHHSVLKTMEALAQEGFEVTYLPVNEQGEISLGDLAAALRPETILVSLMATNNEVGVQLPLAEVGELLRGHQAYFHTDAVQAYGLETIDVKALGIDLMTVTGHKLNGPKGIGFLYVSEDVTFKPFFYGGEQEMKRRPGTENLPSIVGLSTAVQLLTTAEKAQCQAQYREFEQLITTKLSAAQMEYLINGGAAARSPHILNIWLKGVPSDLVLMHLDLAGIAVSIGSACTAGNVAPSHVLSAMYGANHPSTAESLRISFGLGNTLAEIDYFATTLIDIVTRLKK